MSASRSSLWISILAASVASLPLGARAEPEPAPLHLEYAAPPSCPNASSFASEILARTRRVRFATPNEGGPTLVVTIDVTRDAAAGKLVLRALDGAISEREVSGDGCAEVASALALIAALTIDPEATTAPLALVPLRVSRPLQPPPIDPSPAPPPPLSPISESTSKQADRATREPRWRFAIGGAPSLSLGVSPRATLGGLGFLEVVRLRASGFAPTLRVGFGYEVSGTALIAPGAVDFARATALLDACPVRLVLARFDLSPCVSFEAGALRASASAIVDAKSATRPWAALGATARATFEVTRPLFLDASLGGLFALSRDTFFFAPSTTIYEPAILGLRAAVGAGLRFP